MRSIDLRTLVGQRQWHKAATKRAVGLCGRTSGTCLGGGAVKISSLLPHGRVLVEDVAGSLGMSERTLARKLSDEGLNFTEILQQLRHDLAVRYLDDRKLHVSKIAWLLGFNEVSAFTHAFKRWTGKTPREMRTTTIS